MKTSKQILMSAAALVPVMSWAQQEARHPNIMLIVVDDMGYSDPGCFGGEINTPNIDGLARDGVRFTQFFNSGRSCPSRASLLTGLYAHQTGITAMGLSMNRQCVTIPEVLRQAGYHTSMSGKWHLSLTQSINNNNGGTDQLRWLNHQGSFDRNFSALDTYPCNRGFEEHWGTIWGVVDHFDPFSLVHNETPIYTGHNGQEELPEGFYSTDFITEKAIDMLDGYQTDDDDKPFFMYVSYNAPHWPLHAKPEDIAKYKGVYDQGWDVMRENRYARMVELGLISPEQVPVCRNESNRKWENESDKAWQAANMEVHAAMIDCVDQGIGRIIAKLKETGEYDNTVIIFTSDNGASSENYTIGNFDRHNQTRDGRQVVRNSRTPGDELSYNYLDTGWAGAVNTPFRYWKRQSFHGGTAAPTIVVWPGGMKAEKGSITDQPCHFIDLMPTCIELAGAEYPETYNGNNIIPLVAEGRSFLPLLEGNDWDTERTMFWEHENGKAVRKGDWKMTAHTDNGAWQLFDMSTDYSETDNVAAEHPEIVRELRAMWNEWAKSVGLSVPAEIDETEKELVFYLPFDGSLDEMEQGRAVTPNNGYTFEEGVVGQALKLNGVNQSLDFLHPNLIQTENTQFTIAAWVYDDETLEPDPDNASTQDGSYFRDQVIFAQRDNAGTGRIILYSRLERPESGGEVENYYVNFLGNNRNYSSAGAAERGKWQHVVVACNPADQTVTFYVNGQRDRTVTTPRFEACVGGFRIGGHKADKDYWNGKIDELYFYRGLLSAEDVKSLYEGNGTTRLTAVDGTQAGIVYDSISRTVCTANGAVAKSIAVYTVAGSLAASVDNSTSLRLGSLTPDVYIVKAVDPDGVESSLKIRF
ncbi:MAG: sulfatase-like hydrolase/transferase [Clostridium sp.]|nr:sulfatase-like hydrolase/transferase [Clostridium sp.]